MVTATTVTAASKIVLSTRCHPNSDGPPEAARQTRRRSDTMEMELLFWPAANAQSDAVIAQPSIVVQR